MPRRIVLSIAFAALASHAIAGPIILDTDLGDDIDDTWALCMLLGMPDVDVRLITTAAGNAPAKTRLIAKMLERAGRTDIPIGTGLSSGTGKMNQAEWLGDYDLTEYPGTVHSDGVDAIIDAIHASSETTTLLVLGPQMNLKAALERAPDIAQKARVIAMAGSVYTGYNGKEGRQPEWNVVCDIAAAQAVFAASWEVTIAPLDLCGTLMLTGDRYRRVLESPSPLAQVIMENYAVWTNRKHYAADASSVLFDTAAVYLAVDDAFCDMETIKLVVDDQGNTVPDESGRPVRCGMRWKNRGAFEALLIESLVRTN